MAGNFGFACACVVVALLYWNWVFNGSVFGMNINDLRPIGQLSANHGFKALAYGPPGKGKTPLLATAPNPVTLFTEPGTKSLGASNLPGYAATNCAQIDDFLRWLTSSHEARNFQTLVIDSVSEMAEIKLREELPKHKDPRKAYGKMAEWVYDWMATLYHLPNMHMYLIAKEGEGEIDGMKYKRPYFPGQELNTRIPHLYDGILRIVDIPKPGGTPGQMTTAIQTRSTTTGVIARIRHHNPTIFSEYEPPNLAQLFAKAMS